MVDPLTEIRILTPNMVDAFSTIISSHAGTTANLYDRDLETKWTSYAANRDTTPVILTITFNVGSTETQFTLNSLILLNTNAKNVRFEYWDGSAWKLVFENNIATGLTYGCWTFGAVETSRVRITILSTSQHNVEKYIGELVVARQRYTIAQNPISYDINHREKLTTIELGNGERHRAVTRFSINRTNKYGARLSFQYLPQSDYDNLLCLKNENSPFLWYPESIQRPQEIYLVNWVNSWNARYSTLSKNAGYDITMELEEK